MFKTLSIIFMLFTCLIINKNHAAENSVCIGKGFKLDMKCQCIAAKNCFSIPKKVLVNDAKSTYKQIGEEKTKKIYKTSAASYESVNLLFSGENNLKKLKLNEIMEQNKKLDKINKKLKIMLNKKVKSSGAKFVDSDKFMAKYNKKFKAQFSDKNGKMLKPDFSQLQKSIAPNFDFAKVMKDNPSLQKSAPMLSNIISNENTENEVETPTEMAKDANNNQIKLSHTSSVMKKNFKYKDKIHETDKNLFTILSNRYSLLSSRLFGDKVRKELLIDQKRKAMYEILGAIQVN